MTYDADAKKLAVKVIGTVESNLNYGAINFSDPITVGVSQWFGTRAAGLLNRIRTTNFASWYGVAPSLANQLATISSADAYWNSRYLTSAEGNSLVGVLTRNQALQNTQLTEDLEVYKDVAISYGFDPDANTATVIYFFSMHHQSPASALEVVETLDTTATLEQIHAACLAHPVLGQYGARYKVTHDLIAEADLSGVDPVPDPPTVPVKTNGNARLIQTAGDLLIVQFADNERVTFYPNGRGQWTPRTSQDAPPPPTPEQPPIPPDNAGTGDWVLPLTGSPVITSPYGPRGFDGVGNYHWGVDLANAGAAGDVVSPCALVITVAWEYGTPGDPSSGTAGSYVKGHTPDGKYTFNFYHMVAGSLEVSAGDTTTPGQKLGTEGATGNVSGRHLHFEAYEGNISSPWPPPYGNPIDPIPVLRARGVSI